MVFLQRRSFPRRRTVVTRAAAGRKGEYQGARRRSALGDLHRVVSGVQLGITLTSLAIGALGEATFAKMFQAIWPRSLGAHSALFAHGIALACAFVS